MHLFFDWHSLTYCSGSIKFPKQIELGAQISSTTCNQIYPALMLKQGTPAATFDWQHLRLTPVTGNSHTRMEHFLESPSTGITCTQVETYSLRHAWTDDTGTGVAHFLLNASDWCNWRSNRTFCSSRLRLAKLEALESGITRTEENAPFLSCPQPASHALE